MGELCVLLTTTRFTAPPTNRREEPATTTPFTASTGARLRRTVRSSYLVSPRWLWAVSWDLVKNRNLPDAHTHIHTSKHFSRSWQCPIFENRERETDPNEVWGYIYHSQYPSPYECTVMVKSSVSPLLWCGGLGEKQWCFQSRKNARLWPQTFLMIEFVTRRVKILLSIHTPVHFFIQENNKAVNYDVLYTPFNSFSTCNSTKRKLCNIIKGIAVPLVLWYETDIKETLFVNQWLMTEFWCTLSILLPYFLPFVPSPFVTQLLYESKERSHLPSVLLTVY